MKKALLFLLLFMSVQGFAQIQRSVVFDFTAPKSLTPQITPMEYNGQDVNVTQTTFSNQKIKIHFSPITPSMGARYATSIFENETSYYLSLCYMCDMVFEAEDGASLDSIRISDESIVGGFHLLEGEAGYLDPYQSYKYWSSNNTSGISSVTFRNTGKDSEFKTITVNYTEPSDVLAPYSSSIASGSTVGAFDKLALTFSDNMYLENGNNITISNGTSSKSLSASISGNTVTLASAETITTDGIYTITIPARSFKNASGYENKALTYYITVSTPKNTFIYSSVSPTQGTIELLPSEITLTYPTYVKINAANATNIALCNETGKLAPISISKKTGDSKSVILSFAETVPEGISDNGKYTISIPENTITDGMGETYNPAFTLTYEIGGTTPDPEPDPEPEPDPTPTDSETMKLAKQLVVKAGVGYPAANSDTRIALKELTEATTVPTDEDLQKAIDAFYAESNVELPAVGKWYVISGVNNAENEATHAYLAYADGKVTLTTNKNSAAAFEVEAHDTSYAFKTKDGKYLHVLTANNIDYEGTSDKNITSEYSSVNNLTLSKLNVSDVEASKQFGLFTIKGSLGKDVLDKKEAEAFALIDYENGNMTIRTRANYAGQFSATLSSAFSLEETSKPDDEIQTVETTYTLTPDVVESNKDVLTLTFTGVENVTASTSNTAYIATTDGDRIIGVNWITSATQNNSFRAPLDQLEKGSYMLIIPEGCFLYQKDGKTVQTQKITKAFTISKSESGSDSGDNDNTGNFSQTYASVIVLPSVNNYIKDTDFNNVSVSIITGDESDLVADPNKTVKIVSYYYNETQASGHFESTESEPGYTTIKLVLDTPIKEGQLKSSLYAIVIEPGTFGDANFAKYLANSSSVKKEDCKVNSQMTICYNVDNEIATGIDEVTTNTNLPTVIYDLMGRRVQDMSRPGIYIVNGKKVVKK